MGIIMTPKEKAEKLVNRYLGLEYVLFQHDGEPFTFPQGKITQGSAIQCALIAVGELIRYSKEWGDSEYWQQVKTEIEAL